MFGKFVITLIEKQIRVVNNKIDLTISVYDAFRMLSHAWDSVTSKIMSNCFRHAKFINRAVTTESDDEEATDDDIPEY